MDLDLFKGKNIKELMLDIYIIIDNFKNEVGVILYELTEIYPFKPVHSVITVIYSSLHPGFLSFGSAFKGTFFNSFL
ncbi:MAG: hypothetical protein ACFE9Z_04990 [Promethearchaeota archaeon]